MPQNVTLCGNGLNIPSAQSVHHESVKHVQCDRTERVMKQERITNNNCVGMR